MVKPRAMQLSKGLDFIPPYLPQVTSVLRVSRRLLSLQPRVRITDGKKIETVAGGRWHLCLKGEANAEVPTGFLPISHGPVCDPAVRDTVQAGISHGPLAFGSKIIVLPGRKKGDVASKQMTGGTACSRLGVCSALRSALLHSSAARACQSPNRPFH